MLRRKEFRMPNRFHAYTISCRAPAGRVLVHVTGEALRRLSAPEDQGCELSTLARCRPVLEAMVLRATAAGEYCAVVIEVQGQHVHARVADGGD
jgi:demethoxyubiquinone hydroxylase (CLK1/Coq7/Cat5 family)